MSVLVRTPHLLGFGVQMTRFCPAERWLRVRMRTKLGHLVPLSPEKGVPVFACEQDLGELEARERRLRVRMRTNLGSRKLEKGARVFACEQEPWLAFLSKWNFFLTASTIFMVGAVGADTSSFLAPSVSDSRFGFHPAWSHQSSLQASSLSCSGCPVAAVVPVSGSRSSAVSILRSSVVSGCRFFLVSVCRTLD